MKKLRILFMVLGLFVLLSCGQKLPDVPVPAVLTIRVVNGATNQPVVGARVSLKKDSQPVGADIPSASDGAAVFNVTTGDGYKAFAGNATGLAPAASPSIKLVGNQDVVIKMMPSLNGTTGLVAGSVKDAAKQQPLAGVTVTLIPGGGLTQQRVPAAYQQQRVARPFGILQSGGNTAQTDASGQFTFNDVPPGPYKVTFQGAGFPAASRDITVTAGETTAIETVFLGTSTGGTGVVSPSPGTGITNPTTRGHVLLVDAGRAVQLDPQGKIAWVYQSSGISSATRLPDGNTVISDEQVNKVWVIGPGGEVVWDMGLAIGFLSRLNAPSWIGAARDGKSFLITDTGNNRVLEIENRTSGWHFDGLNRPRSATYVPGKGNVLIADTGNNRVIEVDRLGQIVWKFDKDMQAPVHAVRLDDGNTLITDAGYNRVIMINPLGQSVWYYNGAGDTPLNRPRSAIPSRFGTYLIADTGNGRVVEVDRSKTVISNIPNLQRPQVLERL